MDYVQPKKIVSPFSGEWSTPTIKEIDHGDKIVVEAHWYCPTSGQYITRGVVEIREKEKPAETTPKEPKE